MSFADVVLFVRVVSAELNAVKEQNLKECTEWRTARD